MLEKPIMIGYLIFMVTVHREGGFRFIIFTDDHEPAHVHAFGDGTAKINLVGNEGTPQLVYADGMKASDVRKAMRIITEQQSAMLGRWREIHG
jgi:hypothetical protein